MEPPTPDSLNGEALDALCERVRKEVEEGPLEAASFAVGLDGEVVFARAYGKAAPDTPIVVMSPSKTVQDAALWLLMSEGAVRPEDPVARYVPGFAENGKEAVTIEHVMTHTGGFPDAPLDWPDWADRDKRLRAFSAWTLSSAPGSRYTYHPASGSWVLAEIITQVSGMDHREFLRERVLKPLGVDGIRGVSLGEPVADQVKVLEHVYVLPADTLAALPPLFNNRDGTVRTPGGLGEPEGRAAGFPGAGCVGTPSGLARLYQAYLHNPGGLWDPAVLADATGRIRVDMPGPRGGRVTRTLSMYIAGDPADRPGGELAFFGPAVSPRTFGHDGQGGNFVWADPDSGLSFAFLTNTVTFMPWESNGRASELSTIAAGLRS
ncbi:serine hydrolase domain-containing protein [Actinomadura sp. NBRC 104425]|uniref:serine hydrolase domain-containing protein n=1 Tax=Actinomadura sp. NBRC 104425 TaxID=3032204 RepID=UPI0025549853|nr:serine hydrolase domain-containing protein [Actinomadura sp. NBRC 104425]